MYGARIPPCVLTDPCPHAPRGIVDTGIEETKARWSAPPPDTAEGGLAPSVVRGVEAEWKEPYDELRGMLERKTDELELATRHLTVRTLGTDPAD
jgi:hypothetical protein